MKNFSIYKIFDGVLLFFFIYAPVLTFLPFALSKLVFLFLLATNLLDKNLLQSFLTRFSRGKFLRLFVGVTLFIIGYFLLLTIITKNNNFVFVQQSIWLVLEGVVGAFLMYNYLNSKYSFEGILRQLGLVITLQSVIIIVVFFIPRLREIIDSFLVVTDERQLSAYRMRGFSNGGGAGLSYVQSLGMLINGVLMIFDAKARRRYLFSAILILISQLFIARTGLLFSCMLLLSIFFQESFNRKSLRKLAGQVVIGTVLVIAIFKIFISLMSDQTRVVFEQLVLTRAFEFYYNYEESGSLETRSTNVLEKMYFLPDDDLGLLFGKGLWDAAGQNSSTVTFGRKVSSDVGFVRMIFAFGIILTIVYYSMFIFFLKELYQSSSGKKIFFLLLVLLMLFALGETKEPFLMRMSGTIKILIIFYGLVIFNGYNNKIAR